METLIKIAKKWENNGLKYRLLAHQAIQGNIIYTVQVYDEQFKDWRTQDSRVSNAGIQELIKLYEIQLIYLSDNK